MAKYRASRSVGYRALDALVAGTLYWNYCFWDTRNWKTYSEARLCGLQNSSWTISLKPNPNPQKVVEVSGFAYTLML